MVFTFDSAFGIQLCIKWLYEFSFVDSKCYLHSSTQSDLSVPALVCLFFFVMAANLKEFLTAVDSPPKAEQFVEAVVVLLTEAQVCLHAVADSCLLAFAHLISRSMRPVTSMASKLNGSQIVWESW